jgi:hypothetical protein
VLLIADFVFRAMPALAGYAERWARHIKRRPEILASSVELIQLYGSAAGVLRSRALFHRLCLAERF